MPAFEDIELGDELPAEHPDVSMPLVARFVKVADMDFGRFTDHEAARKEGLPGALVPGIMSQAQLAAMITRWAPGCVIRKLDTVFRTPLVVGTQPVMQGAVTDVDPDTRTIEIDLTILGESGATGVLGTALVHFPEDASATPPA